MRHGASSIDRVHFTPLFREERLILPAAGICAGAGLPHEVPPPGGSKNPFSENMTVVKSRMAGQSFLLARSGVH
jgi:hypothetical protein